MERYKNQFAIHFAQIMSENITIWKGIQSTMRRELYSWKTIGRYFFTGLLGFIPGKREHDYNLKLHCIFAVIIFIGSIITNIEWENKEYQKEIKRTLFPRLLKIFSDEIKHSNYDKISPSVFNHTKLFAESIDYVNGDDYIEGKYKEVEFKIAENTLLTERKETSSKKKESVELFKGIAMQFIIPKKIKSRILIYSKNMFKKVPKGYEKVVLESSVFNKKYEIYVEQEINNEGQIEARYLFNTLFMERFIQLQKSFKVGKMQCSVYGNSIVMLLKTNKDMFEMNHLLGRIDDINQYYRLFDEFAAVLSFMEILPLSSKTGL